MSAETLLMVADSDRDANMLYAVGLSVPDPIIYLEHDGQPHVVLSGLEFERARAKARHCRVLSFETFRQRLRRNGHKNPGIQDVIAFLLKQKKIRRLEVPQTFPLGLARDLKDHGFKIKPRKEPVFPSREIKSSEELKKISASLLMAEVGLAEGIHALRHAKAGRKNELTLNGTPLTSERLASIINTAILQAGGTVSRTTVACGNQTSDPNETGHGLLFANQPIILEVSPRSQKTSYYGTLARTVVKGRASEALRALYHTVASAQELAFAEMTEGAKASRIHRAVLNHFNQHGYRTRRLTGRFQGFPQELGAGIGLELEEAPRLQFATKDIIQPGQVIAVAPGLYFPELGGARLKDMAYVTRQRPRNLTKFEKILEI